MLITVGRFRHTMEPCNHKVAVEPLIMLPFFGILLDRVALFLVVTGNLWQPKVLPLIAPVLPPLQRLLHILQIRVVARQLPEHQIRLPELTGIGRQHQRAHQQAMLPIPFPPQLLACII